MKWTVFGVLCLAFLATGCNEQSETQNAPTETQDVAPEEPAVEEKTREGDGGEQAEVEKTGGSLRERFDAILAVQNAIQAHDVETMRKLLKEGAELKLQPTKITCATACVLANFPEGLRVLKEFDFDFDMRDKLDGAPALLCVAQKGGDFNRLEMARVLLECGASVDAEVMKKKDPSLNGLTAFYLAMFRGISENDKEAFDVARFLLEHGADPDKTPVGDEGQTMLQTAIFEKNLPAVELLLKHGASVTKARDDGVTALRVAAQSDTPAKIRQAIAANGKVCDFTIFGIALGQPLPESITGKIDDWSLEGDVDWEMPKPFRRFKKASLERTVNSHRITSILLTCEVGSESQQIEEAEAIRKAIEQKFGVEFRLPMDAVEFAGMKDGKAVWRPKEGYEKTKMSARKDGATITIYPNGYMGWGSRHDVSLKISVSDEEALQLLDGLAAPVVESDLDVL